MMERLPMLREVVVSGLSFLTDFWWCAADTNTRVRTVMENLEKSWKFKMFISRPGKVMEKT